MLDTSVTLRSFSSWLIQSAVWLWENSLFLFKNWNLNAMIRHFKKVRKRLSQFTILTEIHNFDWNSQFWLKFTILTEINNFDWISQFGLKFTILTEFYNFKWNSQFWLKFTIWTPLPPCLPLYLLGEKCVGLLPNTAGTTLNPPSTPAFSLSSSSEMSPQLIDFYCKFIH